MKQLQILVLIPTQEHQKSLLKSKVKEAEFTFIDSSEVTDKQIKQADIIIGNPPIKMLHGSENLKWLQLNSAGYDNYLGEGILSSDTILTNASGAYGLAISEYMVCGLLMLWKKMPFYVEQQKLAQWSDGGAVKSIFGSTILIVGFGDIGNEFAKRVKAMGAHVIGIRRNIDQKPDYVDELYTMDYLDELLPKVDAVSLSVPATKETYHLINEKRLSSMKSDAVLINVGRGTAIDSDALCEALNQGEIGGAYLDVTDPEPLEKQHPLWHAKNVIITPHITGGFHLPETLNRIIQISADNLGAFTLNKPLKNVVKR